MVFLTSRFSLTHSDFYFDQQSASVHAMNCRTHQGQNKTPITYSNLNSN